MQSRDQAKMVHGDTPKMRISEARRALALQQIRIFRVLAFDFEFVTVVCRVVGNVVYHVIQSYKIALNGSCKS
jgi:hypothetical protein